MRDEGRIRKQLIHDLVRPTKRSDEMVVLGEPTASQFLTRSLSASVCSGFLLSFRTILLNGRRFCIEALCLHDHVRFTIDCESEDVGPCVIAGYVQDPL